MSAEARRASLIPSLELELQVIMSHSVWVLESKLGSSARAVQILNCQVITLALVICLCHQNVHY